MSEKTLIVEGLNVAFDGSSVVRDLSFTLQPGRCVALVGESGSGKSVSARSLVGLAGARAQVSARQLSFAGHHLLGGRLQHRPTHATRHVGGGAMAGGAPTRHPVEQAHRSFGHDHVGIAGLGRHPVQQRAVHRPAVEVEGRPATGNAMEGRVDIVRPAFERLHRHARVAQRAEQAERDGRLAGARCGRRNEQARHRHSDDPA